MECVACGSGEGDPSADRMGNPLLSRHGGSCSGDSQSPDSREERHPCSHFLVSHRIGTATGVAESGTIEEIENHLKSGRPTMIYFSSKDVPRNIDTGQLEAIRRAEKNYQDRGLIDTFENAEGFRQKFTRHLAARMVEYLKSQPSTTGSEPNLAPSEASVLARLDLSVASEAVRLLQEASKSDDREIRYTSGSGVHQISANGKDFVAADGPQMEEKWVAALRNLQKAQFVEGILPDHTHEIGDQRLRLTHAAHGFLQDLSKEVLAKFADNDEVFVNVDLTEHGPEFEKRSDYVVRVPRAAAEESDIEWNMRYIFKDHKFEQLVFLAIPDAENFTILDGRKRTWTVNFSPFLGDSDSLP
jgi:hypothetical protein